MLMSAERNGVSCFGAIVDDPIEAECYVQLRVVVDRFCWWFGFSSRFSCYDVLQSMDAGWSQVDHASPRQAVATYIVGRPCSLPPPASHFADARSATH